MLKIRRFHPSVYLIDIMDELKVNEPEFSKMIGVTNEELNQILAGKVRFDEKLSAKLSKSLGTSEEFWCNLQADYDSYIAKRK